MDAFENQESSEPAGVPPTHYQYLLGVEPPIASPRLITGVRPQHSFSGKVLLLLWNKRDYPQRICRTWQICVCVCGGGEGICGTGSQDIWTKEFGMEDLMI